MDWMQILFVTYISVKAGSGLVQSPSSMARAALAPGLEGVAEMYDPVHLGHIHCTLVLITSSMMI